MKVVEHRIQTTFCVNGGTVTVSAYQPLSGADWVVREFLALSHRNDHGRYRSRGAAEAVAQAVAIVREAEQVI